jgi:Na+-transporting NADH:ubiquinone oxidoreductase subunit A
VRYTAPAAGTVVAIHRGELRAFQSIVIDVADDDGPAAQVRFGAWRAGTAPQDVPADDVRALLLESGLWTALRTRPFSKVPAPAATPHALFITAMDTRPHAPPVEQVLAGREREFQAGCTVLAKLSGGRTYLCKARGAAVMAPAGAPIQVEEFEGPHPAGTAGLHIHVLDPADVVHPAWHVGYQDVAAIGHLFLTGELDVARVVSLGGPGTLRPRCLRTRLGASTDILVRGEVRPGVLRIISGSVLDGRTAAGDVHGYLGRHDLQVSVVPEATERALFGWIAPAAAKFSIWRVVLGHWKRNGGLPLDTSTNGGYRAMVPIGAYERVMPMDLMPTFLLRSLIVGDLERAEALGALELDEEDLALCTFVCPGKYEYGPLLRNVLTRLEKEG